MSTHTGIRISIRAGGQPILEGDSDFLHMAAILAGGSAADAESPAAVREVPGERPWHQMGVIYGGPIEVWVQAVDLSDDHLDDVPEPWDGT